MADRVDRVEMPRRELNMMDKKTIGKQELYQVNRS
jgi:hypothetical protein